MIIYLFSFFAQFYAVFQVPGYQLKLPLDNVVLNLEKQHRVNKTNTNQ